VFRQIDMFFVIRLRLCVPSFALMDLNLLRRSGGRKLKLTEWARNARPSPDLCGRINCNEFGESYDQMLSDQEFDADDRHGGLTQFFSSDSSPVSLPPPASLIRSHVGQEKTNSAQHIRKRSLRMGSSTSTQAKASSNPPVAAAPFRAPDWCFDINAKIPSDHVPTRRLASGYVPMKLVDNEASDGEEEDDEDGDDDEVSSVDSDHRRFVDEKIIHGVLGKKTPPPSKKHARAPLSGSYEAIPPWALAFHDKAVSNSPSPRAKKRKKRKLAYDDCFE
jgi:hypothetical protein